jgi:site-specific recombinase XerD
MGNQQGGAGGKQAGWNIRQRGAGRVWTVRYRTPSGREGERSTGTSDRDAALLEGARIYAEEVARDANAPRLSSASKSKTLKREHDRPLPALSADWLACLRTTHAQQTLTIWEMYAGTNWIPWFGGIHATSRNITHELCTAYMQKRLTEVRATSVKKELAALRSFLGWLESEGYPIASGLTAAEVVPRLPKRAAGTAYGKRRRVAAPALAPEQVRAVIRALPEWSNEQNGQERFAVRARFLVQYETGLRPSTFDRLHTPEHYRLGQARLRITPEIDKARYGRDVPLTKRARRVLDYLLTKLHEQARAEGKAEYTGPIFGAHDYRKHIARAARRALPRELAEIFCGAHLRSARITHLLERGANIVGTQFLAGHKQLSTTARYVKPSFRAAEDALGTDDKPDKKPK